MAGLESAAPPVELGRSSKPQTDQLVSDAPPGPPETTLVGRALSEAALAGPALPKTAPSDPALPENALMDPTQSTEVASLVPQVLEGMESDRASDLATVSTESQAGPSASLQYSSSSKNVTEKAVSPQRRRPVAGNTDQSSSNEQPASDPTETEQGTKSGNLADGSFQTPEAVSAPAEAVSSPAEHVSPSRRTVEQAAELDKDLDAVIEELALEVR